MATLLITGHTGFVGRVLMAQAASKLAGDWKLATLPENEDIRSGELAGSVASIRPSAVIHLAARTSVAGSFRDPDGYFDVNFKGTLNLLRGLREAGFEGRFLYVSSGDCYGVVAETELPVGETQGLRPRSPYAVSKVAAESLCYQWSQTEGLDAVIARPFNHIGVGQDVRFVVPALAKQVEAIRGSTMSPADIVTGDLDVTRDLTDVRDVVDAYFALLARGRTGEVYNVGSGRESRLRDVLDSMLELAGVQANVVIDPKRIRPGEQRRMCANVGKIEAHTGWTRKIALNETLAWILNSN